MLVLSILLNGAPGLLLAAEFTMVLSLRGLSVGEYVANRDPVAGVVYLVKLGVFGVMPVLVEGYEIGSPVSLADGKKVSRIRGTSQVIHYSRKKASEWGNL